MAVPHKKARSRSFVSSVGFPRPVVALGVLIIGFMLFLGAISDAAGNLTRPGVVGFIYLAALISLAVYLFYSAWHKKGSS